MDYIYGKLNAEILASEYNGKKSVNPTYQFETDFPRRCYYAKTRFN